MSTYETLLIQTPAEGILQVAINRPDRLNALNETVLKDLITFVDSIKENSSLRALILTGEGRAFVAGADIAAMSAMTEAQAESFGRLGHTAMAAIEALPFPTIAAVNGFALGGGLELALTCDLIYLSDKAKIGLPEVGLGIIPGFGGTQRLGRRIGWQQARRLVFTGETLNAEQAWDLGLAIEVFAPETLLSSCLEIALEIASKGPVAVRRAKQIMAQGAELPLSDANDLEVESFAGLWNTADRSEGMSAFLEKRAPDFKGS